MATLGVAHRELGDHPVAIELLAVSVENSRHMGITANECEALYELGLAYLAAGSKDAARLRFEQAHRLAVEHSLEPLRGLAMAGLGTVLSRTDKEAARKHLRSALGILERTSRSEAEQIRHQLKELECQLDDAA